MPGYELIDNKEKKEINTLFNKANGVLFRHSFENIRNNVFKVKEFESLFAKKMNTNYSLAVSSGTAALRVALASINIGKGDEVITQSFTFVATVESIIESGAIPICTEVNKTLNMDPDDLKKKINSKTKAVIVVHMLGTPANMDEIVRICKKNKVYLIEDTAWGCGGSYKNMKLGTLGDIGTYSFDFAKTITTGEGGMLVFKNKKIYNKACAWHDHGHENNPKVPRWEDTRKSSGFNYRMSELQGAIGVAQIKKLDYIVMQHRKNKEKIKKKLERFEKIEFREVPNGSKDTADSLIFFVKNEKIASSCRKILLKHNIGTKILPEAYTWHFAETWSHMPILKKNNKFGFPITKRLLKRSVSIPISIKMDREIPDKISELVGRIL